MLPCLPLGRAVISIAAIGACVVAATIGAPAARADDLALTTPLPTLTSIWGFSANEVYAVGGNGTVLRYDGSHWWLVPTGVLTHFDHVWGSSPNDIYCVGFEYVDPFPETMGVIVHFDGVGWNRATFPDEYRFTSVYGDASNDVYALETLGEVFHFSGSSWSVVHDIGVTPTDVWASSSNDVFVVGDEGVIEHYDGMAWAPMTSGTSVFLNAIWGLSPTEVFVGGTSNTILFYGGVSWSPMDGQSGVDHMAIWGADGSDVHAVGSGANINHYDGTSWSLTFVGSAPWFYDVWGSSVNNLFAVGTNGTIVHFDGMSWSLPTGIGDLRTRLPHPELYAAYPNPFNPSTKITFRTHEFGRIKIAIYGVDGRRIVELLDEHRAAGRGEVTWSGYDDSNHRVASGVYYVRMETGGARQTTRIVLLK